MCFTTLPKQHVNQMIVAAQHLQELLKAGTLDAAFTGNDPDKTATAIAAFDRLQECATRLASEQKNVSPFLRYRSEIMANTDQGEHLRGAVLAMYSNATSTGLRAAIEHMDDHHHRILLECIASFMHNGDRDTFFMSLAVEIIEAQQEQAA